MTDEKRLAAVIRENNALRKNFERERDRADAAEEESARLRSSLRNASAMAEGYRAKLELYEPPRPDLCESCGLVPPTVRRTSSFVCTACYERDRDAMLRELGLSKV